VASFGAASPAFAWLNVPSFGVASSLVSPAAFAENAV